jgi:AcrR family transcriptional regulator
MVCMEVERSARELLMDAAEVLIGERGLSVSLRELAAYAGQRNNSAVIYHFGGLDGLIEATLQRRMVGLEARRRELLADLDDDAGPHIVIAAIIGPALELPYDDGATHYARFVEKIRTHAAVADFLAAAERWPAVAALTRRLLPHIPEVGRSAKARRIRLMVTAMFTLMADYESRRELDSARQRRRACDELSSILVAVVTAPALTSA